MNTTETVLVILLSIGFITLLTVSIILVSLMIAVMKSVKRISDKAEEATNNIADTAALIGRKVAPWALSMAVSQALRRFRGKKGKKNE